MARFRVRLERGVDGWWVVTVPALPGCISQGRTKEQALANIREAIKLFIDASGPGIPSEAAIPPDAEETLVEV